MARFSILNSGKFSDYYFSAVDGFVFQGFESDIQHIFSTNTKVKRGQVVFEGLWRPFDKFGKIV